MSTDYTVSTYLLQRLKELGVDHLFGVPGDYVLDFLDQVVESPIEWVGNCNELNAGYAADGYARLNGLGGAVVTYGVGGFSILNAVAGAFAEMVPLVLISGAPPGGRRKTGALVHHLVADYDRQLEIFRKVTVDAALLDDPSTAPQLIDRLLAACVSRKLPVYLELPADMARAVCLPPSAPLATVVRCSDPDSLKACADAVAELVNNAHSPAILAGIEVSRFGLGQELLELVEQAELPFATMLSSKSVLPELHPQFIGLYQGGWSRPAVQQQIESADCLLSLGAWMTDLDTGIFSNHIDPQRVIEVGRETVRIGAQLYRQVLPGDLIYELVPRLRTRSYLDLHPGEPRIASGDFVPDMMAPLTAARMYEAIHSFLDDSMILLAEPGDAFCAAPEFTIEEAERFIVQSFYSSIGYCTPAALGVGLARPGSRPVVLTGDGAFQMTVQELSTLMRQQIPAVVLLINNDGYLVERMLHEDGPYNDIKMWQYAGLPELFNAGADGIGIRVTTEGGLHAALQTAAAEQDKLVLIELCVQKLDCSEGLRRLGATMRAPMPRI
ncbi:MAG: thiamine pyrophosphate-binding protein [Trichlorobacter sp.]|uniref:alpha-keto acid decarboxylase family protein n=1 Tax=Trichlorobacter sp. TaxID=2911007 RepID=UPI00255E1FE8|nr:thiamine pyrophosphate-binding protein [Trichlorobacter sp.]MDK9717011.1 thiamine pyrophosphate-binding protein [Trichlorobacter sp.]